MNSQSNLLAAALAVVGLFATTPQAVRADVTEAQVAAAKTPADHEAIARGYDAEAAVAEAKARDHKAMASAYRSVGGQKGGKSPMVRHCERLVSEYTSVASDYRALAAEHRRMAAEAGS